MKPGVKEHLDSPIDKKQGWVIVLVLSLILSVLCFFATEMGGLPAIGPKFSMIGLAVLAVLGVIRFARFGWRALTLDYAFSLVGTGSLLSSFLFKSGTTASSLLTAVGMILITLDMVFTCFHLGKRENHPETKQP